METMSDGYNYATMAKKRMAASALFLNGAGEVLIVKPTYRPEWLLPGGLVEENESPLKACTREIQEELNLTISFTQLLCVEYLSDDTQQTERVLFVFYGGVLEETQLPSIILPAAELSEYRFVPREEAKQLLSSESAKRLPYCFQALEERTTLYVEDGKLPN